MPVTVGRRLGVVAMALAVFIGVMLTSLAVLSWLGSRSLTTDSTSMPRREPPTTSASAPVTVPTLIGLDVEQARKRLVAAGLGVTVEGGQSRVIRQVPSGGASVPNATMVTLETR